MLLARADHAPRPRIDAALGLAAGGIVAICAAGVAIGAVLVSLRPAAPTRPAIVAVGSARFTVPSAWLRPETRNGGKGTNLAIPLRDLAPASAPALGGESVFVRLGPADATMAPADRPALLYARFLSANATRAAGGLIRRPFRAGTPYEGEELFLTPPDGRAFAARCLATPELGRIGATCQTEMRFGPVDVLVRFAPALLAEWDMMARALQQRFGAAAQ